MRGDPHLWGKWSSAEQSTERRRHAGGECFPFTAHKSACSATDNVQIWLLNEWMTVMVPCIFFCLPHKTRSVLRLRRLKSQGRDSTSELLMWLHLEPCWGWGWEAVSWASLSQPSSESPLLLQALLMDSSYFSTPNLSLGWGRPQWVWRWLSPVSPLLLLDHPPMEASVLQRPNMYWASALPDHIHLQISGFLLFIKWRFLGI